MKTINELKQEKDLFIKSLNKAKEYQEKYNSFVTIIDEENHLNNDESPLNGILYALKDNISTKDILTTASSNILKDYIPVYNATVYEKLRQSGAVLLGKTTMDELAMGGTGTTGHTGIVKNPWDETRIIGGSSSGSASAVALGIVPFALGTDTGDSIRKPASYASVVGFKPTYGRVSRYGIIPFASSLDHVGVMANSVSDIALVMDTIKGQDEHDLTTLPDENIRYQDHLEDDTTNKKLFYIKEMLEGDFKEDTKHIVNYFQKMVTSLKSHGYIIDEISIEEELLKLVGPVYTVISSAEATSNHANLTGVLYGLKNDSINLNDMIMKTRTEGFSFLIKRRFIIGSYVLQKENQEKLFLNAQRLRRIMVDKFNDLFSKYDAYLLPTTFKIPPRFAEVNNILNEKELIQENHLDIANFGGFPSITIPFGFYEHLPFGLSITSAPKKDALVLNLANQISKILDIQKEGEQICIKP